MIRGELNADEIKNNIEKDRLNGMDTLWACRQNKYEKDAPGKTKREDPEPDD